MQRHPLIHPPIAGGHAAIGNASEVCQRRDVGAGHHKAELMDLVCDEMMRRGTDEFAPQALSNVIWACATLDHHRPEIMEVPPSHPVMAGDLDLYSELGYNEPLCTYIQQPHRRADLHSFLKTSWELYPDSKMLQVIGPCYGCAGWLITGQESRSHACGV